MEGVGISVAPDYQIFPDGRIVHMPSGKVVNHCICQDHHRQYVRVSLRRNHRRRVYGLHVLLATAFIPNPDGLPLVRHLDGDGTNNSLGNLRWGSHQDNQRDRREKERGELTLQL